MRKTFRLTLFFVITLLVTLQTASSVPKTTLVLKPCQPPDVKGEAKCGTFEVFENRATRK